ncbi:MAG TPA: long-chain fatty acid--CoA ligase [Acidisarcina sp.]|nr:long-chain fatty acid--CoA ligase [Acidisarcina sp.]
MLDLRTLNDVFFNITSSHRERAILWQDAKDQWQPISSTQLYQRVRALAEIFLSWGINKGDRIALLAENRWEWAVADFAALTLGAVDVPIYPTLTAEQIAVLLADSGARIAVVSSRKQYDKVESILHQTQVEHIVLMDDEGTPDAVLLSSLLKDADARGKERDPVFDRRAYEVQPADLATIIYTSGTTGEPKGVMLTHGNIASNLTHSTDQFGFDELDSWISFLPLSHITARHLDYALGCHGATVAYCSNFDKLPTAMTTIKPTVFVAVPRVYEKIRQEAERRASLSPAKARLFAWALSTGKRHRDSVLKGETPKSPVWKLANKLVFSRVRDAFGGQVKYYVSGGAPLGLDTAKWFADVGIRIFEGYGLTETSPLIALNAPTAYRIGSVGKTVPNIECRIAEDGELLVRGPSVFVGYWQKLIVTAEAFDEGHWFRTGDIAHFDEDGFLFVTDRKKELLKTSGGKLIAPQPIENKLKAKLLVSQAALVGDRHKFASALLSPNFAALEEWAKAQGIEVQTRRQLVSNPKVVEQYQAIVDHVNGSLANFETIKRFRIVPDEWSIDSGELTPSLKLKRRVITERYAEEIAAFYEDEAVSRG